MTRHSMDLCGVWRFQPDVYGQGRAGNWFAELHDRRFWTEAQVPITFDRCHVDLPNYEGRGWFATHFDVPADFLGRRLALRFEGVCARASVWLNGRHCGDIPDSYLPFDLPATDFVRCGQDNLLVVEVDNRRRSEDVPGEHYGWRPVGGILREVALVATDPLHIEHVATVAGADKKFSATVEVANGRRDKQSVSIEVVLAGSDGREAGRFVSAPVVVDGGAGATLEVHGEVPSVELWSPQTPRLYNVEVRLLDGGTAFPGCAAQAGKPVPRDERSLRVGFRTIETRGTKLTLNGKDIFLTGYNRHEDSPNTDMCPDRDVTRRDLEMMKSSGCNYVRLCHYPHHPFELDLCDEMGLLAMDEIPLYWCGAGMDKPETAASIEAAAQRQLTNMIRRDCNHASVIFWSVSNETIEGKPAVVELNAKLIAQAKALDPTRLAVHVSNCWIGGGDFSRDDVCCVNGYPTWGQVGWCGASQPDHAEATRTFARDLEGLHQRYPDKPILVTEFGGTSLGGVTGGFLGEDVHAAIIASELEGIRQCPHACGATIWCWADHTWPGNTWMANMHISPFGAVTRSRRVKAAFCAAQKAFVEIQRCVQNEEHGRDAHATQEHGRDAHATRPAQTAPEEPVAGWGVMMVRLHMNDIPQNALPEGYTLRGMRNGDQALWVDIWRDAEPFFPIGEDLFEAQFGLDAALWARRCLLVFDSRGLAAATTSAWFNRNFLGEDYGQIHWVATRRAYQGKGLAKAMMTEACNRLAKWHAKAFLGTQTKRTGAIRLYLDYGFVPLIQSADDERAWDAVRRNLTHPNLERPHRTA
ncbi:MAG: GNAT family N-acetyltransferase [Planctomycetaceae bacterium]|nr:GNAT family N-acetyltransferase [Planctomycetaceae bacterium]